MKREELESHSFIIIATPNKSFERQMNEYGFIHKGVKQYYEYEKAQDAEDAAYELSEYNHTQTYSVIEQWIYNEFVNDNFDCRNTHRAMISAYNDGIQIW